MTGRTSLTIVLAAGEGTRMQSSMPKVLHPVAGQSLLAHVLEAAPKGAGASLAVVIGSYQRAVAEEVKRLRPDATTFIQRERLGTAHAVLAARDAIARGADDLLVVFGDTPLISVATLARMRAPLKSGAVLAVLGFQAADPTGYGRLLVEGDRLVAIREHADATPAERMTKLCNAGAAAQGGARGRRDDGRARNRLPRRRYDVRQRRDDRTVCGDRSRRLDRRRRGDPFVFSHRAVIDRQESIGRPLCALKAGNIAGRGREDRQFRRDQGRDAGSGRQGQSSQLYRRRPCRSGRQHRRRHHRLQL